MIGILGGTFDPIHYGHLRIAVELLERLGLEQMRLIPSSHPPHRAMPHASGDQRLAMVQAAITGVSGLFWDDRELRRPGPSYMVDTLQGLQHEFETTPLVLVIGSDAVQGLDSWHRWQSLFELAHLVIAHRPGWVVPEQGEIGRVLKDRLVEHPVDLSTEKSGLVLSQPVTQLDISSTALRASIRQGKRVEFLLPPAVLSYIQEHGLYRDGC